MSILRLVSLASTRISLLNHNNNNNLYSIDKRHIESYKYHQEAIE